MIKVICDLCGEEITSNDNARAFKIKERVLSFHELFWDKIDAHDECVKAIAATARELKEENGP